MNDGPSPNLYWVELACRDGSEYPQGWRGTRAVELGRAFERVRELCGFPLIVNSGYRSPAYNARIGGAAKSMHVQGQALDLHPAPAKGYAGRPGDKNSGNRQEEARRLKRLGEAAEQARDEKYLQGIGYYANFVHIDTRASRATWYGSRTVQENTA